MAGRLSTGDVIDIGAGGNSGFGPVQLATASLWREHPCVEGASLQWEHPCVVGASLGNGASPCSHQICPVGWVEALSLEVKPPAWLSRVLTTL